MIRPQWIWNVSGLFFICSFSTLFPGLPQVNRSDAEPSGFVRLVQRGAIESIDHPLFVPAKEAEIAPEAWVLGVVIDGEARAYSLSLLNSHEVVNDEFDGRPVAAVW